jgi:hypothetical protein
MWHIGNVYILLQWLSSRVKTFSWFLLLNFMVEVVTKRIVNIVKFDCRILKKQSRTLRRSKL